MTYPVLAQALRRFHTALADPQAAQQRILRDILAANAGSRFGQAHGFAGIGDYAAFARRVPVRTYEDFRADIEALADGEPARLTSEAVAYFEATGGSSGGAKLVPYTPVLLAAFQRAVLPWLADLQQQVPQVFAGRLFFIISPAERTATHTAGGLPIGNGSDLAYLGEELGGRLAARTLFQPELLQAQSAAQWQWRSAQMLLAAEDLSLMSVWSPTLLLAILDTLQQEQDSLLAGITDTRRRARLTKALSPPQPDTRAIWPQLSVISAWSSHTAAAPAEALRRLFPEVLLQGKGLLATEAVSSIPFSGSPWPLLAVNSHFYELRDADGEVLPATAAAAGRDYGLLLTTQGGLYRYDSGDQVRVHGFWRGVPQLEFIGRGNLYSDLCGEKLSEAFVRQAMQAVDSRLPEQALLQGVAGRPSYYRLLVPAVLAGQAQLAEQLDAALAANPQYAYARRIGQLGRLRLEAVDNLQAHAAAYQRPGQKFATRKTPLLLPPAE